MSAEARQLGDLQTFESVFNTANRFVDAISRRKPEWLSRSTEVEVVSPVGAIVLRDLFSMSVAEAILSEAGPQLTQSKLSRQLHIATLTPAILKLLSKSCPVLCEFGRIINEAYSSHPGVNVIQLNLFRKLEDETGIPAQRPHIDKTILPTILIASGNGHTAIVAETAHENPEEVFSQAMRNGKIVDVECGPTDALIFPGNLYVHRGEGSLNTGERRISIGAARFVDK